MACFERATHHSRAYLSSGATSNPLLPASMLAALHTLSFSFPRIATLIREGSFFINNWIFTVGWGAVLVYATDADSDHRLGTIPAASAVSLPRLLPRPALINQSIVQERRDMKITSF